MKAARKEKIEAVRFVFKEKIEKLKKGDELAPGVIKMVKVQIAIKRRLQVGDKMAGRHGNKGVISKIVPDGRHAVHGQRYAGGYGSEPSRGSFAYEHRSAPRSHARMGLLGESAKVSKPMLDDWNGDGASQASESDFTLLRKSISTSRRLRMTELKKMMWHLRKGDSHLAPRYSTARPKKDIAKVYEVAGLPQRGQTTLFDGVTGEPFAEDVTVGVMYMLKLHHLVEEKIHARSIGPYSLVTQQPLGGKAQFGGQRLGEMEVWALEAYGAAFGLQEFLTVKSDDVTGRNRMYEAIVKGEHLLEPGLPESFNVLVKELQSLALERRADRRRRQVDRSDRPLSSFRVAPAESVGAPRFTSQTKISVPCYSWASPTSEIEELR